MVFSFVERGWIDLKTGMFAEIPEEIKDADSIEVEFKEPQEDNYVLTTEDGQAIIRPYKSGDKGMYVVKQAVYDMRTGSTYRNRMDKISNTAR